MYRYSKSATIKDALTLLILLFLTAFSFYSQKYYWSAFGAAMFLLLLKDFFKTSRLELLVKSDGLYEKVGEKERMVFDWKCLAYITRTRKFAKYVTLADENRYFYYLKPSLEEREALLKEILNMNKKNRNIVIDHHINTEFNLGLKLDDLGKIKKKKDA